MMNGLSVTTSAALPDPENNTPTPRRMPLHVKILIGLIVGAALGLTANYFCTRPVLSRVADQLDAFDELLSDFRDGRPVVPRVSDALDRNENGIDDRLDWVADNIAEPVGKVFLRLMFMVVLPLVFSALSLAVVQIGDLRRVGRMGLRTLFFTALLSFTAVVIGITLVNLFQPGRTLSEATKERLQKQYAAKAETNVANAKKAKSLRDTLVDIVPENPLQEMVGAVDGSSKGNGMLAVMFFALVVGMAITAVPEKCHTFTAWLEGLYEISMVVIGFAMRLAPVGAGCLVFTITARLGIEIVVTLFGFVLTALLGLGLHLVVVYSVLIALCGGTTPWRFFRNVSEAMLMAFGTSSSNATLPTALKVAQEKLKLPRDISSFVLTVGATGNQNGTALYEGVVVLFLAQVFGVELTVPQQLTVVLMSVLAGIGTAGVPGGSLPLIVVLLTSVGVPGEGIGIILGVDRLLDMCRTVLNVTGDLAVATCVARTEPESTPP